MAPLTRSIALLFLFLISVSIANSEVICGGFASIPCPAGYKCVDKPGDGCDPKNGGADCIGFCKKVPVTTKIICGGFAGTPCPGGYSCVDDPTDSCDPKNGGADCIGVCKKTKVRSP